jgi:uncharacterized protein (DUF1501 family)
MKRRKFLLGATSGITVVANADHVFARALAQTPLPGLPGGGDRVPRVDQSLRRQRRAQLRRAARKRSLLSVRPRLRSTAKRRARDRRKRGVQSGMQSVKAIYDKGMVAIVQGVGYPDPDHSHFRSTEIWQTAAPDRYEHTGWLGRYFDQAGPARENLFQGVAVSKVLPEVLVSERTDIPAVPGLGEYVMMADRNAMPRAVPFRVKATDSHLPFASPYLAHVMEIEANAQRSSEELPKLVAGYKTQASYPATGLGRSLALAAQIVGSNLGTKVIYVEHGSFDTHVSQKATQNRSCCSSRMRSVLSTTTSRARQRAPRAHAHLQRVRAAHRRERQPRTDHGEASPLFLIGGGVKGGLYGTPGSERDEYGQRAVYDRFSQRLRHRARALARPSLCRAPARLFRAASSFRLSGFLDSLSRQRRSALRRRPPVARIGGCGSALARRRFTWIRARVRSFERSRTCRPAIRASSTRSCSRTSISTIRAT